MPTRPSPDAALAICRAVDGARWARFDEPHRLLFLGKVSSQSGWMVHSLDAVTGEEHDAPWPLDYETVAIMGEDAAFAAAVNERVKRGF